MLAVPGDTLVFAPQPLDRAPYYVWSGRPGRPRWLAPEARPKKVQDLAARLPRAAWHTVTGANGTPAAYRYAFLPVWECPAGQPGREVWLVLRQNRDSRRLTAHLSNAPATTTPETLGQVSAMNAGVRANHEQQKNATGLDEYEVRSWRGWHHHITLSLLAGALLRHFDKPCCISL